MIIKDFNWNNIVKDFILKHNEYSLQSNKITGFMNSIDDDKDVNDITMMDIDSIIVNYYMYNEDHQAAYKHIDKYIYMWKSFFDYLKKDKLYIKAHVLEEQVINIEDFINSVIESLKNGLAKNKYYIDMVEKCLRDFKEGIEEDFYANRQRYMTLQSCIFINFVLLTGLSKKILRKVKLCDVKDKYLTVFGENYIISQETNYYIDKYLEVRNSSSNHEYFFTKFNGEEYKDDTEFNRTIPNNNILGMLKLRGVVPKEAKSFKINELREAVINSKRAN